MSPVAVAAVLAAAVDRMQYPSTVIGHPHGLKRQPRRVDTRGEDDLMSRAAAIARAHSYFDSGEFLVDLRRRVAIPSTSQEPERAAALRDYLDDEMVPSLASLGFTSRILDNPSGPAFLVAERIEDAALLTVLIYGHGDTIRGLDDLWRPGLSPWVLDRRRRAHLWPRHRRQQGPAQHQHRGAGGDAGRTRSAGAPRLQRQNPDRDGRGGRLGRAARALQAAQGRPAARPTC